MSSAWLFEPEPPAFRKTLAEKLARAAARGILIGTSSWKYEGWLGQIYTPERYSRRDRFSARLFEETCLEEYAAVFPIVCGDFTFYQFPSLQYWQRLFRSAPASLLFAFKAPEEITVRSWPHHARYGPRAGQENPSFLNAETLSRMFLELLEPYRQQVALIIFEFGTFPASTWDDRDSFSAALDRFLTALPPHWNYAVEIRNSELLDPSYLECLRRHRTAHVFNAWTRMPGIEAQMAVPEVETAAFSVARALLRRGRSYEEAVRMFQPYTTVRDENPAVRSALQSLIRKAAGTRRKAYVFVNNRLEGNAPSTIDAVLEGFD
jgi:uncharacterized protein YecE (DUF72 family)